MQGPSHLAEKIICGSTEQSFHECGQSKVDKTKVKVYTTSCLVKVYTASCLPTLSVNRTQNIKKYKKFMSS